jgi:hypothetical protein
METLANTPKQEERKLNLYLMGFEAKEGETEKELVQRLNTELLQGQVKLRAKIVTTTWQQPVTCARPDVVLLKFAISEDC